MSRRPDPDHDAVCGTDSRHQLIVAPPGTGKTHLSVRLAGALAGDLAPTERVLLLTFSNQARVQLEREVAVQLGQDQRRRVHVTNYHRLFFQAVRAHRRALGLPAVLDIGSSARRQRALRERCGDAARAAEAHPGLLEALAEQRFAIFHDERTPNEEALGVLLAAVEVEQRAGRLVFDDLGALFWQLLEDFPTLHDGYRARFPVVIADEHQDASALQDAVVRRLGNRRLTVLADPMQLIHGFRGADMRRLDAHRSDSDDQRELHIAHRWHGDPVAARWLLAVRARLQGCAAAASAPPALRVLRTPAAHGMNAMLPVVAVSAAREVGDVEGRVAVLCVRNNEVAKVRAYLCKRGLFPRQLTAPVDFEDARQDIEQLPLLHDPQRLGQHAMRRLGDLVPALPRTLTTQITGRLGVDAVNTRRASPAALPLLHALAGIYTHGRAGYFAVMVELLDACAAQGHHLPRRDFVRVLRETHAALGAPEGDIDRAIAAYAQRSLAAAHAAPREGRGIWVMTCHQAKGKEFDAVIIVGAGQRSFPDREDGRRLFYVAMTRAMRSWTIIAPDRDASPLLNAL